MSGDTSPDDGRVGPDLTHAAVVACCILGLVLVAGFLPAVDQVGSDADAAGIGNDEQPADPSDDGPDDGGDEDDGGDDPVSRDISVAGTTPGQEMRVTVRSDGDRVSDATVTVDGGRIGETDENGVIETSTPYEPSVNVSASHAGWTVSERVALSTDVDVTPQYVDADAGELTVRATIDGVSVPDATVTVGDERIGETDDGGVATVPVPTDGDAIGVRRGATEGATVIDADEVAVPVQGAWFVPKLPLGPATARVEMDGVPVRNAPVTVDGERVGTTDPTGKTRFRLPASDSATIGTEVRGESAATELDGLVFTLAWSVLGALSLLIGGIITYLRLFDLQARRRHRRWIGDGLSLGNLWPTRLLSGLGAAVAGIPAALRRGAGAIAGLFGGLGGGVGWLSQFGAALRLPGFRVPSLPSLGGLSALSLLPSLDRGSRSVGEDAETSSAVDRNDAAQSVPDEPTDDADDSAPTPTVRRAWHRLVDRLGVSRRETRTPGQIARRAVDAGYPDDAVDRLTAAFRDVEYGGRSESEDRVRAAYEALDRIRSEEDDEP